MTAASPDTVLVIGASGILAPAAAALIRQGKHVTGVSRIRAVPPGVRQIRFDAGSVAEAANALGGERWESAIVYQPAVSRQSFTVICERISGRVVQVCTSAAAEPLHDAAEPEATETAPASVKTDQSVRTCTLLLGWHSEPGQPARWHTPEEISAAALNALAAGSDALLGRVRPWADRPE